MVATTAGSGLVSQSEITQKFPIKIFTVADLGVDQEKLLRSLLPSYEMLTWDYYDVRREQIDLIQKHGPALTEQEQVLVRDYYRGVITADAVRPLTARLDVETQAAIAALTPYRRRHVTNFVCRRASGNEWKIEIKPSSAVAQNVDAVDYRSIQRVFPAIMPEVWNLVEFQKLLRGLARLAESVEPGMDAFEGTCWQNGIVARQKKSASNSPEGIHQDGSDYIVSALVLERKNVTGGMSRVFGPDKKTTLLEHVLMPGEGIFQADAGSPLWHDVTPVSIDDTTQAAGVRNMLGFDINILDG